MKFVIFNECFVIIFQLFLFPNQASLLNCSIDSSDPRCSKDAEFIGCYRKHCIQEEFRYSSLRMDMGYCFRLCNDRRYTLAGLYDGNMCLCGCSLSCNVSLSDAQDQCGIPCPGSVGNFCGGRNAVQTYRVNTPFVGEDACQEISTAAAKASEPSSTSPSRFTATPMTETTRPATRPIKTTRVDQTSELATYNYISTSNPKTTLYATSTSAPEVVNYASRSDESTSSLDIPLVVSFVVGFALVAVVGTLIVITVRKKIKSRSLSSLATRDLTKGNGRKGSSAYADENFRPIPSYQPLNAAPPLPYRPSAKGTECAKAPDLTSSSSQRNNNQFRNIEGYMDLKRKGEDPKECHIYCDMDDFLGPYDVIGAISNSCAVTNESDSVVHSVSNDIPMAVKDDLSASSGKLAPEDTDGDPPAVDTSPQEENLEEQPASPEKEGVDEQPASPEKEGVYDEPAFPVKESTDEEPTYDTNLPPSRVSSGSSVSHDYETEISSFMAAAPKED